MSLSGGYGICLNRWLEDASIKNEIRVLIKISSLTAKTGTCYASNEYLAKYFKTTTVTISRQISKLSKLGYLSISYTRDGAVITSRNITIATPRPAAKKTKTKKAAKKKTTAATKAKPTTAKPSVEPKPKASSKYDVFMDDLKASCKIKSKVTKTKTGKELFKNFSDIELENLRSKYIAHQIEKGNYAKRVTAFMEDWSFESLSSSNNKTNTTSQQQAQREMYSKIRSAYSTPAYNTPSTAHDNSNSGVIVDEEVVIIDEEVIVDEEAVESSSIHQDIQQQQQQNNISSSGFNEDEILF